VSLSSEQFSWLLRGLDVAKLKPHSEKYFIVPDLPEEQKISPMMALH
jgi:hypothetical protein